MWFAIILAIEVSAFAGASIVPSFRQDRDTRSIVFRKLTGFFVTPWGLMTLATIGAEPGMPLYMQTQGAKFTTWLAYASMLCINALTWATYVDRQRGKTPASR